jgi:hypothetical protein
MDHVAVERWIRARVEPVGPLESVHVRPWATVLRVPLAQGAAWFKACSPVEAFEPQLSARLSARWPVWVAEVLDHDQARGWLLLADAGTPLRTRGNPPDVWLRALPPYAELQRGESAYASEHLSGDVPDLRVALLPARYEWLLEHELPLDDAEIRALHRFTPRFAHLCDELAAHGMAATVQHDDLHAANLFERDDELRILDWGDSSISHPFASLVVTFRFLEETNKLRPTDRWFTRLRDAYLEPWGSGLEEEFSLAVRVGKFSHAIAWARQRDALPSAARADFDKWFAVILRRALAETRH